MTMLADPSPSLYDKREAEAIIPDGPYSKSELDASLRELGVLDYKPTKHESVKDQMSAQKNDMELIVKEFDMSQAQAEKVLTENRGDLAATLYALVVS